MMLRRFGLNVRRRQPVPSSRPRNRCAATSPLPFAMRPTPPMAEHSTRRPGQALGIAPSGTPEIEEVHNDELVLPLDAATDQTSETWWPTYAVANLVWLRKIEGLAADRGSLGILNGGHGNAAFSYSHSYAARFLLQRHDWRDSRGWQRLQILNETRPPRLVKQRIIAPRRPPDVGLQHPTCPLRWLALATPHRTADAPGRGTTTAADPSVRGPS